MTTKAASFGIAAMFAMLLGALGRAPLNLIGAQRPNPAVRRAVAGRRRESLWLSAFSHLLQ